MLLTAEGKNGKMELTESLVKITYYKSEMFKINKSKIENIQEIPRDLINEARITAKGEFRVFIPNESDPQNYSYFVLNFKPEQQHEFEMIAEEIGMQGFWYEDKSKMSHVVSYDDEEKASIDANKAAKNGWMPQSTSATDGHINIGRTLARGLIFGAHRTKGKFTITYGRTPEWMKEHHKDTFPIASTPVLSEVAPNSVIEIDPVAKLKQLKEMLDAGLVSQDEYDKTKAAILARM